MSMMSRKIGVVTGSRADYGLLHGLLREIRSDSGLQLQLIATGMHLSPEFGLTWKQITADGFHIDKKLEMLLSSDTPVGIAKATGLGVIGFADVLADLRPDLLVVLGDRFEIFAAAQAAMHARIPVAHIHGGELSEGAVDDAMRHAITKMAHLHFTATEIYRQRVIQMGEQPARVFNVGAPGLDCLETIEWLDEAELQRQLGVALAPRKFLVTYHPVTLENDAAERQIRALCEALDHFPEAQAIFTLTNADAGGRVMIRILREYRQRHPDRVALLDNLGRQRYWSLLRCVDAMVGNSSSGLIEAPAIPVATVNIGNRQRGRLQAASVVQCEDDCSAIVEALQKVLSDDFRQCLSRVENPYGKPGASKKIKRVLASVELDQLFMKTFYDWA